MEDLDVNRFDVNRFGLNRFGLKGRLGRIATSAVLCSCVAMAQPAWSHPEDALEYLHFSHPIISESPSPDTKIRFNYDYFNEAREEAEEEGEEEGFSATSGRERKRAKNDRRTTAELELEYAFSRSVSVEVGIPYTFLDVKNGSNQNRLGNVEVALKYASFRFADKGLLLGAGIELGLPTGKDSKDIGSDEIFEIEPFVSFGYERGKLELIGFLKPGIITNETSDDADFELGWNLSASYLATSRIRTVLELDGEEVRGGEEDRASIRNLTSSLKYSPSDESGIEYCLTGSIPISADKEFDSRALFTVFYHFY